MASHDSNIAMFELAVSIEQFQQDLYGGMADLFSDLPVVSRFWDMMRRDELHHERTLVTIRRSVHPDRLSSTADPSMLALARSLVAALPERQLDGIVTLDDAYQLAHELENSEFNTVFRFITREFISEPEVLSFALSEIDTHLRKLTDFPRAFGDRKWRKSVKAVRKVTCPE